MFRLIPRCFPMDMRHYKEWIKIGLNILYYRKEQRLTQQQLADACGEEGISRAFIQRPLIGIITKIDSPYANIPMVRQWLINAGCERIFMVNNVTREGIDELMEYLEEDEPHLTLEQAMFKQRLGLNEWDPLPEGVEYPKD